jgi:hypothetical protein
MFFPLCPKSRNPQFRIMLPCGGMALRLRKPHRSWWQPIVVCLISVHACYVIRTSHLASLRDQMTMSVISTMYFNTGIYHMDPEASPQGTFLIHFLGGWVLTAAEGLLAHVPERFKLGTWAVWCPLKKAFLGIIWGTFLISQTPLPLPFISGPSRREFDWTCQHR